MFQNRWGIVSENLLVSWGNGSEKSEEPKAPKVHDASSTCRVY
jgi:hypothetical protein